MKRETVERFSGRAELYQRHRARFPKQLIQRLEAVCGLQPEDVVADVGAGTGMLAELFLEHGNRVIAVEPNDEMRAVCEGLLERYPKLAVENAGAEATRLPDASVDMVAVGRAFHWFDRRRAIDEFARILRAGGWVALVTSTWSGDGSAVALEFEAILKTQGTDYQRVVDGQMKRAEMDEIFLTESVYVEDIASTERLRFEELLGRAESLSVTPRPSDTRYPAFRAELDAYFARHMQEGYIEMPVCYRLICGRLRTGD